jgi:hypothetical protein
MSRANRAWGALFGGLRASSSQTEEDIRLFARTCRQVPTGMGGAKTVDSPTRHLSHFWKDVNMARMGSLCCSSTNDRR